LGEEVFQNDREESSGAITATNVPIEGWLALQHINSSAAFTLLQVASPLKAPLNPKNPPVRYSDPLYRDTLQLDSAEAAFATRLEEQHEIVNHNLHTKPTEKQRDALIKILSRDELTIVGIREWVDGLMADPEGWVP